MREETQAGGGGEEEAGSQQRSLTQGSIPEYRDHALSQRQMLNDCATQAPQYKLFYVSKICVHIMKKMFSVVPSEKKKKEKETYVIIQRNARLGAPVINGISQFLNPPIMIGVNERQL